MPLLLCNRLLINVQRDPAICMAEQFPRRFYVYTLLPEHGCLLLADKRVLVLRLRLKHDKGKSPFVEQEEVNESARSLLEVLAK